MTDELSLSSQCAIVAAHAAASASNAVAHAVGPLGRWWPAAAVRAGAVAAVVVLLLLGGGGRPVLLGRGHVAVGLSVVEMA